MNHKVVFLLEYNIFETKEDLYENFELEMGSLDEWGIDYETLVVAESDKGIINQLYNANIVICWGNPRINDNIISNLPELDIILRYGVGTNSVDIKSASKNNVVVYNLPDCSKKELAYHSLSLILANLRNIVRYDRKIRSGIWDKGGGPKPRRLENLIVGLYGLGNSGRELARMIINGFGSKVIANDPFVREEDANELGVQLVDFNELIRNSDIISIHTPLTEETKHIFNRNTFAQMKSDSMLINVSRGPIININDLCAAMENGKLKYCGLDVFEEEPIPLNHKLLNLENCILTPHSAYFGTESEIQMGQDTSVLLKEFLIYKRLIRKYIVNKEVINNVKYEVIDK